MQRVCLLALVSLLLYAGQTASSQLQARLDQARAEFARGNVSAAREAAEALHAENPQDLRTAVFLANCYIKMGRAHAAVALLGPLEAGHESDVELEYSLAFAMIQSDNGIHGVERMERVARASNSANAWTVAGAARFSRQEFALAKSDLDQGLALDPSQTGLNTLEGKVHYALEDPDGAFPFFQAALRANPRDFEANLYDGMHRMKHGDFDGAKPLLELALELEPDSPLARLKMAEWNGLTGNYRAAIAELEKLENETPNWLDPHVQLAALYYKQHRAQDGKREREIVEHLQSTEQKAGPSN